MIETGKDVPQQMDQAVSEAGFENQNASYADEAVTARRNQRAAEMSWSLRLDQCALSSLHPAGSKPCKAILA